tara:strand:- start:12465 stop:13424 length:960 start_codon:yes stop_codon:yes gene_type:complete
VKKLVAIANLKTDAEIQGFYLCKEKHLRRTRSGELFVDIILADSTGTVGAKVWRNVKKLSIKFEQGDAVAVRGRVEIFQEKNHVLINRINKATEARYARYGFKPEKLVPSSPFNPEKMWSSIGEIVNKMEDPFLKKLIWQLYRKHKKRLITIPASLNMHYTYRSGYLEHVLSMSRIAISFARHYRANVDLLIAGVLLHGIGKVIEFTDSLVPELSDEGSFLGHSLLSRDMVLNEVKKIKNFPSNLLIQIEHLIITHEGGFRSGYDYRGKTKEALLLQALDTIDAKLSVLKKLMSEDIEEGKWTNKRNYFGTSFYKGDKK